MSGSDLSIFGIVVTYNPIKNELLNLINKIINDLDGVIIVDNCSHIDIAPWLIDNDKIEIISLPENAGIAVAQNVGIQRVQDLSGQHVVLFDQDSDPDFGLVKILKDVLLVLQAQKKRVACLGPVYYDKRHKTSSSFIQIRGLFLKRVSCEGDQEYVQVDHLIASGTLIPMDVIDDIGRMQENLFIDYVDLEWCERALFKGYQPFGVCAAKMNHSLGDEPIKFLGTAYPSRSPLRHYYMCRNAVWMYKQNHVRWNWKIVDSVRLLRKFIFYSSFASPRHLHFFMMIKGLWHGMRNKMGRLQE